MKKYLILLFVSFVCLFGFSSATDMILSALPSMSSNNTTQIRGQELVCHFSDCVLNELYKYSAHTCSIWGITSGTTKESLITGVFVGSTGILNIPLQQSVVYRLFTFSGDVFSPSTCSSSYAQNSFTVNRFATGLHLLYTKWFNGATLSNFGTTDSNIYSLKYSATDVIPTYTITTPIGTGNITSNITFTGTAEFTGTYPNYQANVVGTYFNVYYNGTSRVFDNSITPNIYLSGFYGFIFSSPDTFTIDYTPSIIPIGSGLISLNYTGQLDAYSGSVIGQFMENIIKLSWGQIPIIITIIGGIFLFWLILSMFGVRFKKKKR